MFGEPGNTWRLGAISSDAEFVSFHRKPGSSDQHLIFSGGSFAIVDEEIELRCTKSMVWAELVLKAGNRAVFCSDMADTKEAAEMPSNPASRSFE
jgi:hypothetical protein